MSPASGPEAIKAMLVTYYPDIATLAAMIAHSQIVVREPPRVEFDYLPAGFDEVDVFVLDWIAAEARRARHVIAQI
jgi:hypothetical protein